MIWFIFLYSTYLMFDFICLTPVIIGRYPPDTYGIAKYARTYSHGWPLRNASIEKHKLAFMMYV